MKSVCDLLHSDFNIHNLVYQSILYKFLILLSYQNNRRFCGERKRICADKPLFMRRDAMPFRLI